MPLPKDPQKAEEYRKRHSVIMSAVNKRIGRTLPRETRTCAYEKCNETFECPTSSTRKYHSRKCWIEDKKGKPLSSSCREGSIRTNKERKGKTYEELYGDRAEEEKKKRKEGNRNSPKHKIRSFLQQAAMIKLIESKRGKTYEEIYGDRAEIELRKRSETHTKRWDKIGRKCDDRPYQGCNADYGRWRKDVFERDNYTCQICKRWGGKLNAHHIKSWAKFLDERYNVANGVTLCVECHKVVSKLMRELKISDSQIIVEVLTDYY